MLSEFEAELAREIAAEAGAMEASPRRDRVLALVEALLRASGKETHDTQGNTEKT